MYSVFLVLFVFLVADTYSMMHKTPEAANDRILSLPGYSGKINFSQYAGFVNVDPVSNRNLFYWYVQSQGNPATDPLLLWLNGGPGCSSLAGFFTEQGPFRPAADGSLYLNPYAWNNISNVIFLESPAGVGFSYSGNTSDYRTGDVRTASDAVKFLQGFLKRYPEFKGRKFWVSGESYGGHYVTQLTAAALEEKKRGGLDLDIQGFAVGNAWTDTASDNQGAVETWWNRALISDDTYHCLLNTCNFSTFGPLSLDANSIDGNCNSCLNTAQLSFQNINIYDIYVDICLSNEELGGYAISQLAKAGSPAHVVLHRALLAQNERVRQRQLKHAAARVDPPYEPCITNYLTSYLNQRSVLQAIHAQSSTNIPWTMCSNVLNYSYSDLLTSVLPVYRKLLKEYPKLKLNVFSGDVDAIVPYWGSRQWISLLNLPVRNPWRAWLTDDQQAGGFVQDYLGGQLTFITVRNAGHMVPGTQPKRAFHMIKSILTGTPL